MVFEIFSLQDAEFSCSHTYERWMDGWLDMFLYGYKCGWPYGRNKYDKYAK